MSKVIRLSLELTLQNPQEVSDLISMLQPFATAKTEEAQPEKPVAETPAPKEEKPNTQRKPRKTAAQKKAEAEEAEEAAKLAAAKETEQKESEEATESKEATETKEGPTKAADASEVKIEDVRALLAKKVGSFRSEIKAKLTELEAKNVTNLDKSKYGEFVDFLNSL